MKPNDSFDDVFTQNQRETDNGNNHAWAAFDATDHVDLHDRNGSEDADVGESRKCNARLIKKSGNKFVAAIKSLQCSPRVDKSDYCKLEKTEKSSANYHQQPQQLQQQQLGHEQPAFFADFDNFELLQRDLPSVSKNLELERLLEKLDNFDGNMIIPTESGDSNDLEIFTCDTDDTIENDENSQKFTQKKDDDDIECLCSIFGSKLDSKETYNQTVDLTLTPSSKRKPLIQNEFSQFSNDSNDTPVTCNKSIILTPKREHLNHTRNDEQQSGDDDNFFCKPPKELLHRSLSLGDSLSPTDDSSPNTQHPSNKASEANFSEDFMIKNTLNDMPSNDCQDDEDHDGRCRSAFPSQKLMEGLKLPDMNARMGLINLDFAEGNVLRNVEQIERQETISASFAKINVFSPDARENMRIDSPGGTARNVVSNEEKTCLTHQDDASPVSSTISSFVFSSDNGNNLEQTRNEGVMKSEQTPSSFFWKTHPRLYEKRLVQQKSNHSALKLEPSRPAFFWKTHPRVTIKSYNFQQRKTTIRKVNAKLENRRSIHRNA